MPITYIPKEELDSLLAVFDENKVRRQLDFVYRQIPANKCEKCGDCCFASAEVHFSEFLNIYSFIQDLPEEVQKQIAERVIRYEFLSLVTLDHKCPFLWEKSCLIYDVRALQCRFFGLYPPQEYRELKQKSLDQNITLAQYFARMHRLLLPKEVMTYDIDQCKNNFDEQGKEIVITHFERDLIYNQIVAIHNRVLPDHIIAQDEDELNRFTYLYAITKFDGEELENLKVEIVREYLTTQKTVKLDALIKQHKFDFGMGKVRSMERTS